VGGIIAQTMATILQQQGEEVRLLALLDAYPSHQWRNRDQVTEQEALAALLQAVGNTRLDLSQIPPQERDLMLARLRDANPTFNKLDTSTLNALLDTARRNINLARQSLLPRSYSGKLVFFTAAQGRTDQRLTHIAWEPFIEGTIENYDLECNHAGILAEQSLQTIAQVLANHLS
jgi:enterobactin synthetase component F